MIWLLALGGALLMLSAVLTRHDQVEARRVTADLTRASSSDVAEGRLDDWRSAAVASCLLPDGWATGSEAPIDLTPTDLGWGFLDEQREEWTS